MNRIGFAQAHRVAPTIAVVFALLLVPAAIAIEKAEPRLWSDRLILPSFTAQENLHTPREYIGTFLPPTISTSRTLTIKDSPVILTKTTTIPLGVTVTLEPGVEVFAHEYGALVVNGMLVVNGIADNNVVFTTNEKHPTNQTWSGIVFGPTGHGTIQHTHLKYGSPGITCAAGSAVVIQNTTIELGSVGVFTQSPNCSITQSIIKNVDTGIVSFQQQTSLLDTLVTAREIAIKTIQSTSIPPNNQLHQ